MRFFLDTFDGGGGNLGTLTIGINAGSRDVPEAFFWEWQGPGVNDGGPVSWHHDGAAFHLQLMKDGFRAGVVHSGSWSGTNRSASEPPRPWFTRGDAGIGGRMVPEPPPQRLLPAFNWRLP
jgi:hypothetical protein